MRLSLEFSICVLINILSIGIAVGVFISKINLVLFRIEQLEKKQDRYNSLQERMIKVETQISEIIKKKKNRKLKNSGKINRKVKKGILVTE